MFLIAGVSPKIRQLDNKPRRCPSCGLHQAYYKQVDHYFSLFFIPLLRVKKGEPILVCERCENMGLDMGGTFSSQSDAGSFRCDNCDSRLQRDYKYCPYCGKSIEP